MRALTNFTAHYASDEQMGTVVDGMRAIEKWLFSAVLLNQSNTIAYALNELPIFFVFIVIKILQKV